MQFEFDPSKVTVHAVIRYAQRILDVSIESDAVGRSLADDYAAAAGLTVEDIQARIYTRATAAALGMGLTCFTIGDVMMIARGGVITTIVNRVMPKPMGGKRLRLIGEAENRRNQQKFQRRNRRQNVPQTETGE